MHPYFFRFPILAKFRLFCNCMVQTFMLEDVHDQRKSCLIKLMRNIFLFGYTDLLLLALKF